MDLIKITRGFMLSKALFVAHELDIFDRLAEGGKKASDLADEVNASEKGIRRLCNALSGFGVLVKNGDKYFLPDDLREFLLKDGKSSFRNYIGLSHDIWYIWSDLEKVIREGKPVTPLMDIVGEDEGKLKKFIHVMHERGREFSPLILEFVDISNRKRMLDMGGGSGTYSLEWMKRYPQLRAIILDLPHVIEITKDYVKRYDMEDRVSFISGNFHELEIGEGRYDLVLMANILYGSHEENRNLIKKAYNSLEEHGMAIIYGFALDDNECEPVESALLALSMLSTRTNGNAYKKSEYMEWLKEAGFNDMRCFENDAISFTVITAIK
jgi:ubiquinone/menaquinone biosynthesis C-methylase UbiE